MTGQAHDWNLKTNDPPATVRARCPQGDGSSVKWVEMVAMSGRKTAARGAAMVCGAWVIVAAGCVDVEPGARHDVTVRVYGQGRVLLDPAGGRYAPGSEVTVMAVDDGEGFSFWGGALTGDNPIRRITIDEDLAIVALFEADPKPSTTYSDPFLLASDGQFLGVITDNPFRVDGIANPLGTYGSTESTTCIWNALSNYGADFGDLSPFSSAAGTPPLIISGGAFFAFCTVDAGFSPRRNPNDIARDAGREDAVRD